MHTKHHGTHLPLPQQHVLFSPVFSACAGFSHTPHEERSLGGLRIFSCWKRITLAGHTTVRLLKTSRQGTSLSNTRRGTWTLCNLGHSAHAVFVVALMFSHHPQCHVKASHLRCHSTKNPPYDCVFHKTSPYQCVSHTAIFRRKHFRRKTTVTSDTPHQFNHLTVSSHNTVLRWVQLNSAGVEEEAPCTSASYAYTGS